MTLEISNLRKTIEPQSDQLNAEQLLSGPIVITVTGVTLGSSDQPVIIHYTGDDGRPFKPCKTCRKILIFAWGEDGREWVGKSMQLYNDPDVRFGGVMVGGIRISHLSHIEADIIIALNATKGKKAAYRVKKMGRTQSELAAILIDAAKAGTEPLKAAWKRLTADERAIFNNACPDDAKAVAAAADKEKESTNGPN